MKDSSCVSGVIDKTVHNGDNRLSVKELHRTAGVSRSGYYAWVKAAPIREAAEEQERKANASRRMTKALKTGNAADNLLQRGLECYGPGMVLLTDITYLPYNGVFACLSTILDAFTKQVQAYVVGSFLEVDFVLETINILIRDHGIPLNQETILYSDQGCHDTSYKFIELLQSKSPRQSMSRRKVSLGIGRTT